MPGVLDNLTQEVFTPGPGEAGFGRGWHARKREDGQWVVVTKPRAERVGGKLELPEECKLPEGCGPFMSVEPLVALAMAEECCGGM